jgi:hypothetical protein
MVAVSSLNILVVLLIVVVMVQSQGNTAPVAQSRVGVDDAPQTEHTPTNNKDTNEQDDPTISTTTATTHAAQPSPHLVLNMHLIDGLDEETFKKARGMFMLFTFLKHIYFISNFYMVIK